MSMIEKFGGRRWFEPPQKNDLRQLERKAATFAEREPDVAHWYGDFISRIDFKAFEEIFAEHARRAGVQPSAFNRLDRTKRFLVGNDSKEFDENTGAGDYSVIDNVFTDNGDYLKHMMSDPYVYEHLLGHISHELVHATASVEGHYHTPSHITYVSGFEVDEVTTNTFGHAYKYFNEGMTEYLARQSTEEYLRRSPLTLPSGSTLTATRYRDFVDPKLEHSYETYVSFVREFIGFLGRSSGISEDAARQALIKSYYDGTGFFSDEAEQLLESLAPDLAKRLATAMNLGDFLNIFNDMELTEVRKEVLNQIRSLYGI